MLIFQVNFSGKKKDLILFFTKVNILLTKKKKLGAMTPVPAYALI